jgi:hypothetical protein
MNPGAEPTPAVFVTPVAPEAVVPPPPPFAVPPPAFALPEPATEAAPTAAPTFG